MDVDAFRQFLKAGGRSVNAALRAVEYVRQFEEYLELNDVDLDDADPYDLESYVAGLEAEPGISAKLDLWGITYYYQFVDDPIMVHVAATMRRDRVEQTPFRLRQFRGIDQNTTDRLAAAGIRSVEDLLKVGTSASDRAALAVQADVPIAEVEELVRLADLARVPGLKSIRARLYLDAGVRSVADLAARDAEGLTSILREFVAETGFDGIAPLAGETRHAIEIARKLPPLITW